MIHHRTRGILRLRLAIECAAVTVLFWLWFCSYIVMVPSGEGVAAGPYLAYLAALLAGLLLETFTTDFNKAIRQIQDPGLSVQLQTSVRQTCFSVGVLLLFLVLTKDRFMSRLFLVVFLPAEFLSLLILNRYAPRFLVRLLFNGTREERVLLVGPPEDSAKLKAWLNSKSMLGFRAVGSVPIVCASSASGVRTNSDCLVNLHLLLTELNVTLVILFGQIPAEVCRELLGTTQRLGVRFLIYNNLSEQLRHPVVTFSDDGLAFFALRDEPLENPFNRVCKRLLDLLIALPSIFLVLPVAAIVIRVFQFFQSPGPLFHRQIRAGMQNRRFCLLKFRTMHPGHDQLSRQAKAGDPRVFAAGRLFRRISLDELPQFVNVLRGEMSVVGPRPHLIEHNREFAELLANYHIRSLVKPGMTGLAQVRGLRGEAKTAIDISARLQSDLAYLENWSLLLELSIIARTVWQLIFPPKNAR
ncbi:MAG: exopolysaccharide biosynthesis polyprenyl glycosylphosphotransferase [Verrucomicrobia bacterium]|nr:exopolysaccharide biosynthesis polyprenyl glycosylphosphotransferase [Verrucomicrobiota bacterium]